MDSVGEGEGGKIWENGIETCKISCMKWEKKKDIEIVKHHCFSLIKNIWQFDDYFSGISYDIP